MAKRISAFGPLTKKGKLTPWGFLMFMSLSNYLVGVGVDKCVGSGFAAAAEVLASHSGAERT